MEGANIWADAGSVGAGDVPDDLEMAVAQAPFEDPTDDDTDEDPVDQAPDGEELKDMGDKSYDSLRRLSQRLVSECKACAVLP